MEREKMTNLSARLKNSPKRSYPGTAGAPLACHVRIAASRRPPRSQGVRPTFWSLVIAIAGCIACTREEPIGDRDNLHAPNLAPSLDGSDVCIELQRTECLGDCPVYTLRVARNGLVEYEGVSNVFAMGVRRAYAPEQSVANLLSEIEAEGFFLLKEECGYIVTDVAGLVITVRDKGRTRTIRDASDYDRNDPDIAFHEQIRKISLLVEGVTNSAQWVRGAR